MTDDIEQRRALVQQLHAQGLSQRQIAERIGVDHSTVQRDLQIFRANGMHQVGGVEQVRSVEPDDAYARAHQVAEDREVRTVRTDDAHTREPALTRAAEASPDGVDETTEIADAVRATAGGAVARYADFSDAQRAREGGAGEDSVISVTPKKDGGSVRHPLPWEQQPAEEQPSDTILLLAKVAELGPGGVSRGSLYSAVGTLSKERFDRAFSAVQVGGFVIDDQRTGGLVLTTAGRMLLTPTERHTPRVDLTTSFERYKAAAADALPSYEAEARQRLETARRDREWQAMQLQSQLSHLFSSLRTFALEWQWVAEPDLRLPNVAAIRPKFPLPADIDVYLHVLPVEGGLWLRPSTGGRDVALLPNQGAREIEQALGLALRFGLEAAAARAAHPNLNGGPS